MIVIQNELTPGTIQDGLSDLMRDGVGSVRVCSAYISVAGSHLLHEAIARAAPRGDAQVEKTIVSSLDFGITEPDALAFWQERPNCRVLVAGTAGLERRNLIPRAAFHTKFYLVGRPDGSLGSLIGSANLTGRGLTVNSEVAWVQYAHRRIAPVNAAWEAAIAPATPLTAEILEAYAALRPRALRATEAAELEPVPAPEIAAPGAYPLFADADPNSYDQMWIQSRGMQGGAGTQLELPRGAHRFFGAAYEGYEFGHVEHIAEPVLVAGTNIWRDRPLTWHGDNAMERINLPSATMGGFNYEHSLILFRRIGENTFELRVYPGDSDSARAYVEASQQAGLIYRVGRNSPRIAGLIP
jgi:HKD family nuclease